jgi:hypothetical protein
MSLSAVSAPGRDGAHDQDRTGDLVLTKDALYRLSYVGVPSTSHLLPATASPSGAGDGIRTRDIQLGRLELYQLSYTRAGRLVVHRSGPLLRSPGSARSRARRASPDSCSVSSTAPPVRGGVQVVGREGFEPSKPQGRQIYSLLRLTASLPPPPPRASVLVRRAAIPPRSENRGPSPAPSRKKPRPARLFAGSPRLELAEGIEPPTR